MVEVCLGLVTAKHLPSIICSSFSKSLPNLNQPQTETELSQKFTDRVYSSTHRISGARSSYFISPLGGLLAAPSSQISSIRTFASTHTGQLLSPRTSDPYIATQITIRTQFARSHEFEDLLNSIKLQSTSVVYQKEPLSISESPSESTGLTSLLPTGHSQQDITISLPSVRTTRSEEDLTLKEETVMPRRDLCELETNFGIHDSSIRCVPSATKVPAQYAMEYQDDSHQNVRCFIKEIAKESSPQCARDDALTVIGKRTTSVNDLRKKFEESRIMYLPKDSEIAESLCRRSSSPSRNLISLKRCQSVNILNRHSPLPPPPSVLPTATRKSVETQTRYARPTSLFHNPVTNPVPDNRWKFENRKIIDISPTRRQLPKEDMSPRSINRAAFEPNWPDGVYTKTGDVYKRIDTGQYQTSNGVTYIIASPRVPPFRSCSPVSLPTSPEHPSIQRARHNLTINCSDYNSSRLEHRRHHQPTNWRGSLPCISRNINELQNHSIGNYSYLEHTQFGRVPFRSAHLSNWTNLREAGHSRNYSQTLPTRMRKADSQPTVSPVRLVGRSRHGFPRVTPQPAHNDDVWKYRAAKINSERRKIHELLGSWSPSPSPPRYIQNNREERTEAEIRNQVIRHAPVSALKIGPTQTRIYSTPHSPLHINCDVDQTPITREFDSNIALFEKLSRDNLVEAHCSSCPGCCQCASVRIPLPTRLVSTRRSQDDEEFHSYPYSRHRQRDFNVASAKLVNSPRRTHPTVECVRGPGGAQYRPSSQRYPLS